MSAEKLQDRKIRFATLLRQNQGRLFGYIHSLVNDLNDTDDLFQQTAIVLWKKFTDFDESRSFFSWACGVARLEVTNFIRKRGRRPLQFTDELNLMLVEAQEQMSNEEMDDRREALSQCIEKLPPADRELVQECYNDEAGVNQAAERRGRVPQSVYNSLRRIRRTLFDCIQRTLTRQTQPGTPG